MNEEYLWDKTGDDPDVKRLESLLTGFKYQEIAPPVLPVREAAAKQKRLFTWRFSLPLAFAGVAVIALLVTLMLTLDLNTRSLQTASDEVLTLRVPASEPVVANDKAPSVSTLKPALRPEFVEFRKPRSGIKHERTVVANKQKEIVLTREEKDAYGRLLLALSITSSKLKIVTDTINRTDEGATTRDPNNR